MNRNSIKSGLVDQRDRATKRRKTKKPKIQINEPEAKLTSWLNNQGFTESVIKSLSLKNYLNETQNFDVLPEERLRQLAIHLETKILIVPSESNWQSLKRIYDYALNLNNKDSVLWLSFGIAAHDTAENIENNDLKEKLYSTAESAILNSIDLNSKSSRAYYILGYLYYFQGKKQESLNELEKALLCENDDNVHSWAQLYKAHCLHDMKKWQKALLAYKAVNLSAFTGPVSWRVDVLKEQIAECTYFSGNKDLAETMLTEIINRYETEPKVAIDAMSYSLWNLAKNISENLNQRAQVIYDSALGRNLN